MQPAGSADRGGERERGVGASPQDTEVLLALLQHASDAVGVIEPDGRLRAGPIGFLGYPIEELTERFVLDLIHPDEVGEAANRLLDAMATPGVTEPFRCRLRHANGEWRWFEVVGSNLVADPAVGGLIFSGRDITEQRTAEESLQRSERRWRRLLHSATEHVTVIDANAKVLFTSADGSMLGYEGGEYRDDLGVAVKELLHPDDVKRAYEQWARVLATPGPSPPLLTRVRTADGRWKWTEAFANNLLDDPDVGGVIFTTRDVTEREEAASALREEKRVLDLLHAIGRQLTAELDLDALLQAVTDTATDVTDAAFGAFFYNAVGPSGDSYLLYTLSGAPREAFASFPMPRATAIFAPTFEGRGPVRINDVRADPRYGRSTPYHGMPPGHLEVCSYLAVPVISRSGEVHGGLFFGHPEPGVFTERGERLAAGIASHAAIAIDNARLFQAAQREIGARRVAEAELAHQANHDPLTGLPNRVLLEDRLSQAIAHIGRDTRAVAVLLLDLDRFKVVNDSLGHPTGDRILIGVAERLLGAVRPGDTVARLSGDEFVLVCDGVNGELDAVGVADRIAAAFAAPFVVDDVQLSLTASVGIAMAVDRDSDPEVLLRDADAVMYRAKERGGNRWEIFDASLRYRVVERLRIETDLRRALDANELHAYFQPIVALGSGGVVGAEALARWEHPDQGLVLPDEFVKVAEESGLVVSLGEAMLLQGCRQLAAWAKHTATADLTMSINVSARQLANGELVNTVRRVLDATGADPARLSLEITETGLMDDVEVAGNVLRRLRSLGVQFWVDDFGTGYSSLIYLRRLPLDGLKIDRSFVAGLASETEDRVIVAGIINLAHSLGLVALAEGVETDQQAERLRALGCDQAQGFLWSPAMPVEVGSPASELPT